MVKLLKWIVSIALLLSITTAQEFPDESDYHVEATFVESPDAEANMFLFELFTGNDEEKTFRINFNITRAEGTWRAGSGQKTTNDEDWEFVYEDPLVEIGAQLYFQFSAELRDQIYKTPVYSAEILPDGEVLVRNTNDPESLPSDDREEQDTTTLLPLSSNPPQTNNVTEDVTKLPITTDSATDSATGSATTSTATASPLDITSTKATLESRLSSTESKTDSVPTSPTTSATPTTLDVVTLDTTTLDTTTIDTTTLDTTTLDTTTLDTTTLDTTTLDTTTLDATTVDTSTQRTTTIEVTDQTESPTVQTTPTQILPTTSERTVTIETEVTGSTTERSSSTTFDTSTSSVTDWGQETTTPNTTISVSTSLPTTTPNQGLQKTETTKTTTERPTTSVVTTVKVIENSSTVTQEVKRLTIPPKIDSILDVDKSNEKDNSDENQNADATDPHGKKDNHERKQQFEVEADLTVIIPATVVPVVVVIGVIVIVYLVMRNRHRQNFSGDYQQPMVSPGGYKITPSSAYGSSTYSSQISSRYPQTEFGRKPDDDENPYSYAAGLYEEIMPDTDLVKPTLASDVKTTAPNITVRLQNDYNGGVYIDEELGLPPLHEEQNTYEEPKASIPQRDYSVLTRTVSDTYDG